MELALGVGLLLVPAVLLVMSFGPWLERRSFVRLASAEAARAVVLSGGDGEAALGVVAALAVGYGIDPDDVTVGLCGDPVGLAEAAGRGCGRPVRGGTVDVVVGVRVPLVATPFGGVGGVEIEHRHTEVIDLYRSLP